MSKFAAYLGPAMPVSTLLEEGSYPLTQQANEHGDGFAVGWFPNDDNPEPARYAGRGSLARHRQFLGLTRRLSATCILAAVNGHEEHTLELSGCQPFGHGPYLFAHDGELTRFREVFERPLRQKLTDKSYRLLRSSEPSELLFATWLDALDHDAGPEAMANAMERMVTTTVGATAGVEVPASFAAVTTNGQCLVTLRTASQGQPPPLYTIVAEAGAPVPVGGRIVSSEPLFAGNWTALEPNSLIIFTVEEA